MEFQYPEFFARFYDVIYNQIRSDVDSEYFLKKICNVKGPVLEVGVGTGRFFIEALAKGADIYGFDISPAMIEVLRKKLEPEYHNRISIQNATCFHYDNKFDLIIAPFRVFSHLIDRDDQLQALNMIHKHLNDNGRFIFDLFVPDPSLLAKGVENELDFEGEYEPGKKVKRFTTVQTDLVNQLNDITFRIEWDEGDKTNNKEWNLKFRFFYRFELEYLIEKSNLTLENIFGDYQESPLSSDSKEFLIVCKK